jgi:magnesium-transporting ATPase (P-type)
MSLWNCACGTEIQRELGRLKLYCKGADSVILRRLRDPDSSVVDATVLHIEEFSRNGYRTLCIAEREVCIKRGSYGTLAYLSAQYKFDFSFGLKRCTIFLHFS